MTTERDLLDRALGTEEPPMNLDFDAIESTGARAVRRRRAMALTGTAAAVVLAAVGGFAAFGPGAAGPQQISAASDGKTTTAVPSNRTLAYCYRTADITSTAINQHIPVGINGSGEDGRGDVAASIVEICTGAWADDVYQWHTPGLPRVTPPLTACVLTRAAVDVEAGTVGVFPGDKQTCASMGLPVARL
ncbi:hypothetical protein [Amycolatopsis sp. H20-H5]|uniref:hypothetical protein n=1 Tax=Amycolatopsis sp. H20-H5 TaxID=3046309 RepID=UPI002DB655AD|nr:hypothetical protein [Amycolatopsis sp. H20-H5]MEC3975205.1 hypothetical protein [Amycolatopsis sp. H20-H5]